MKKRMIGILLAAAFVLALVGTQAMNASNAKAQVLKVKTSVDAVSKATKKTKKKKTTTKKKAKSTPQPTMDTQAMPMTPVDSLTLSEDPMYPVGTEVIIDTDHMPGMMGASGVVSGAYDTTLYAVNYTATDGMEVKNHRWVIAEEIENSAGVSFKVGDAVTLGQGHMASMTGAGQSAVITQVVPGPAYMVDYNPVDGSARVTNHQWVAEFELKSADSAS